MSSKVVVDMIKKEMIVAIVRGIEAEKLIALADALYAGGIRLMEVTYDHSSEEGMKNTLRGIELLCEKRGDKMLIGAGTVLSAEEVKQAGDAGAKYIITPNVKEEVITTAKELGLGSMPGAFTPTEIAYAYELGADIVKVFPAGNLGPSYIKAVRGPLGHIPLAAVGGVSADNIAAFKQVGCIAFGVGGNLVDKKKIAAGDFKAITDYAKKLREAINLDF